MTKKPEFGLLIDYEFCTGCFTCQVACSQEPVVDPGEGPLDLSHALGLRNPVVWHR